MLRNLGHELVNRRLWPIPLVALLVAIAAPLLFMKSDSGAPATTPEAAASQAPGAGGLPGGADRLLSTKEPEVKARKRGRDPFKAPAGFQGRPDASAGAKAEPAAAKPATASTGTATKIVEQLKKATEQQEQQTARSRSGDGAKPAPARRKATARPKAKRKAATPVQVAAVDVRFGRRAGGAMRRAIPRHQVFAARGRALAIFVRYAAGRGKALFAVAPGTVVTGSVSCERVTGVCRYVAIPDGGYARLTVIRPDGTRVVRRIDVSVRQVTSGSAAAPPAATPNAKRDSCLLGRVTRLVAGALPISLNVCS